MPSGGVSDVLDLGLADGDRPQERMTATFAAAAC